MQERGPKDEVQPCRQSFTEVYIPTLAIEIKDNKEKSDPNKWSVQYLNYITL